MFKIFGRGALFFAISENKKGTLSGIDAKKSTDEKKTIKRHGRQRKMFADQIDQLKNASDQDMHIVPETYKKTTSKTPKKLKTLIAKAQKKLKNTLKKEKGTVAIRAVKDNGAQRGAKKGNILQRAKNAVTGFANTAGFVVLEMAEDIEKMSKKFRNKNTTKTTTPPHTPKESPPPKPRRTFEYDAELKARHNKTSGQSEKEYTYAKVIKHKPTTKTPNQQATPTQPISKAMQRKINHEIKNFHKRKVAKQNFITKETQRKNLGSEAGKSRY